MDFSHHPCFDPAAHKRYGRVHLPVAPRCNIQCKFCNRKFDCVNESRPGVTSGVLSPAQAMIYLKEVFSRKKNISVVGIAGPGDPFANPDETLETLRRVRETWPDMMLCVATNGLNALPYLDELARLKVSHVTVTVNAIDPDIARRIYSWVRYNKRVFPADRGVTILMEQQIRTIRGLKERGITVKVNSIIIPGINEDHIESVARKMSELGVDILNCVPYYPNKGSAFENLEEPSALQVADIRKKAGVHIAQMHHCTRCRADAVGFLGEAPDAHLMARLQDCERMSSCDTAVPVSSGRTRVAVASMEGVLVNQHLGQASALMIYGKKDGIITLLETRSTPAAGAGSQRWDELAGTLSDCGTLLVSSIGQNPRQILSDSGIEIHEVECLIEDAVRAVFEGRSLRHMIKRRMSPCSGGCGSATC